MAITPLQQTKVGISGPDKKTKDDIIALQFKKLQDALLNKCPAHLWPKDSYKAACPMPILISKNHQQQLKTLQEALTIAIVDIVDRWWTDRDARFPERMPLEKQEEELLKVNTSHEMLLI